MNFFLRNVEIHLNIVGIMVILIVPNLFGSSSSDAEKWKIAAITAIIVGAVHGFLFWMVRRRQRNIRNEIINVIQNNLLDTVNNSLQVLSLKIENLSGNNYDARQAVKETKDTIEDISDALNSITSESLNYTDYNY